jgi:hypothetical protein
MRSKELSGKSLALVVTPTGMKAGAAQLSIQFKNTGEVHELSSVRLGAYQAQLLKAQK